MKKTTISFVLSLSCLMMSAQQQAEYNRLGDEALARHDNRDAKIWYEEGVSNCDPYSINQLTSIWLADKTMRISMRNVMTKCLSCLTDRATEVKDTAAINKLILYYREGIGTSRNESAANFWKSQLGVQGDRYGTYMRRKNQSGVVVEKHGQQMTFFAGYAMSPIAPVGITFGGVGSTAGFYVRFRTNMSFQNYIGNVDMNGHVEELEVLDVAYMTTTKKKSNALIATGGLVFKVSPSICLSIGAGYWKRDVLWELEKINLIETVSEGKVWARYGNGSMSGAAIDLDGMYRMGDSFYISLGVSALNFKNVYLNAGFGLFF